MRDIKTEIAIGGLLHDIGNIACGSKAASFESVDGTQLLRDAGLDNERILEQIQYNEFDLLDESALADDSLAYITCWAKAAASSANRIESAKTERKHLANAGHAPLYSIFNKLNGNNGHKIYSAAEVQESGEINYPTDGNPENDGIYLELKKNICTGLKEIEFKKEYINSLLSILERELTYIPAVSDLNQAVDISLYDHLKITAAVGSSVYQFLDEQGITNYREALGSVESKFYDENCFLLFSMDISGIQRFIYKVDSSSALKSLRARSFYLEVMLEHIIDELLEKVQLSRANLIYSGGGHAYILLPNTEEVKDKLQEFKDKARLWFIDNYGIDLYVAMGYEECSANNLRNIPTGTYEQIFKNVSGKLSNEKISRYSAADILHMNTPNTQPSTRECKVCGRVDSLTGDDICDYCSSFKKISVDILNKSFDFVTVLADRESSKNCVKLPFDKYMVLEDEQGLKSRVTENDERYVRSYCKNKMHAGVNVATKLWVGDYSSESSFENLAGQATGVNKLGVLRADVDNLGKTFISGFKPEDTCLARTASFSRKLSMFFKLHINHILENGEFSIGDLKRGGRNATIVYSGGDDVFLVGAWDDVIELAVDLSDSLRRFSQGTLTISAGIGIFPRKYPVKAIARQTGELEDASKRVDGKNAITLFEDIRPSDSNCEFDCGEQTYKWEIFKERVIGEKYAVIDEFFSGNNEKGMSAIYKLLNYVKHMDDKINLARLAYLLGRMQAELDSDKQNDENYRDFSKKIYGWLSADDGGENSRELITAIYIYVYLHRVEEEK